MSETATKGGFCGVDRKCNVDFVDSYLSERRAVENLPVPTLNISSIEVRLQRGTSWSTNKFICLIILCSIFTIIVGVDVNLGNLPISRGFSILGGSANDQSGSAVSAAGDVNGDGYGDVIVGASRADITGQADAGIAYVIFGRSGSFSNIQLPGPASALPPTVGFRILGSLLNDNNANSVGAAGDVNNDGVDDIIVGAPFADPPSKGNGGICYVIFGRNYPAGAAFFGDIFLTTGSTYLAGNIGFRILGAATGDRVGSSVNCAGDVNGDGIDDVIVGAILADPASGSDAGISYVIFGRDVPGGAMPFGDIQLDTTTMNAALGFRILGAAGGDRSGSSVAKAGDVNGDGVGDVIIGVYQADPSTGADAGITYVIFGRDLTVGGATPFGDIQLTTGTQIIDGDTGFRILGAAVGENSGISASAAGDVNGDGIDDILVGAHQADLPSKPDAGIAYVIFGRDYTVGGVIPFSEIQLTTGANTMSATVGFRILGAAAGDFLGASVHTAGDVNGDGISDIIFGAYVADPPSGNAAGITYVLYGRDVPNGATPFADIQLSTTAMADVSGYRILGVAATDQSGFSVSTAGDVNGDGIDDIIIGANQADVSSTADAGVSYVLFGFNLYPTSQPSGQPSRQPTSQPSRQPSTQPSRQPSRQPSSQPSLQPTVQPTVKPSMQPSSQPSMQPSGQPNAKPSSSPSAQPSRQPSCQPTSQPSVQPTSQPTVQPSQQPSSQPSVQPSCQPNARPSSQPNVQPSTRPSTQPSSQPSMLPTLQPSARPSRQPSSQPTSLPSMQPSSQPSAQPSMQPSSRPTIQPSSQPTVQPSMQPSSQPTMQPSDQPSSQPSMQPLSQPSVQPSAQPSGQPSYQPFSTPSSQPSSQPIAIPSSQPSAQPSSLPSCQPTTQPSHCPSRQPSAQPSCTPTTQPSKQPSSQPSTQPSSKPSMQPTSIPSEQPTVQPSRLPSSQPSAFPTTQRTAQPSALPSNQPSIQPSGQPSAQPSVQPSAQLSQRPTSQPTKQPSTQPSMQPSAQPTNQPSLQPVGDPTIMPTISMYRGEWTALINNSATLSLAYIHNMIWACGEEYIFGSQSQCTTIEPIKGEIQSTYTFPWTNIKFVLEPVATGGVILGGVTISTAQVRTDIATCLSIGTQLQCTVNAYSNTILTYGANVPFASKFVYVGTYNEHATVVIYNHINGATSVYRYSTNRMASVTLLHAHSPPTFIGAFVAGTCVSTALINHIFAGMVRTDSGIMTLMYLTPAIGNIVKSAELVNAMALEYVNPDSFIAGGLELSDDLGMHAYIVRVNSLYYAVLYGMRYRISSNQPSTRRALSTTSAYNSIVKGMVRIGSVLYMVVNVYNPTSHVVHNSTAILKVDARNGQILQQVQIESHYSGIQCSDITTTTLYLAVHCTITSVGNNQYTVVLSMDTTFTLSRLPEGFQRFENVTFVAEPVLFRRTVLPLVATNIQNAYTEETFNTADGYNTAHPSFMPTSQPSSQPSSAPSGQPSGSPTSAPSVSPQPTSQPSSSGPTNTYKPTVKPTQRPSTIPSVVPTMSPSVDPTITLTAGPSLSPSVTSTTQPSIVPTRTPTRLPTIRPTRTPSIAQTTYAPTLLPTTSPTKRGRRVYEAFASTILGYVVGGLIVLWCTYQLVLYFLYKLEVVKADEKIMTQMRSIGLVPKPRHPVSRAVMIQFFDLAPSEENITATPNDTAVVNANNITPVTINNVNEEAQNSDKSDGELSSSQSDSTSSAGSDLLRHIIENNVHEHRSTNAAHGQIGAYINTPNGIDLEANLATIGGIGAPTNSDTNFNTPNAAVFEGYTSSPYIVLRRLSSDGYSDNSSLMSDVINNMLNHESNSDNNSVFSNMENGMSGSTPGTE